MKSHKEWLAEATGDSMRAVARKIGVNEGNFPAKVSRGLDADTVIKIARAYELGIVPSLIETGHMSADEAPEVLGRKIDSMMETLQRLHDQSQYGLAADSSREEGDGNPDDYEP